MLIEQFSIYIEIPVCECVSVCVSACVSLTECQKHSFFSKTYSVDFCDRKKYVCRWDKRGVHFDDCPMWPSHLEFIQSKWSDVICTFYEKELLFEFEIINTRVREDEERWRRWRREGEGGQMNGAFLWYSVYMHTSEYGLRFEIETIVLSSIDIVEQVPLASPLMGDHITKDE